MLWQQMSKVLSLTNIGSEVCWCVSGAVCSPLSRAADLRVALWIGGMRAMVSVVLPF